MSQPFDLTHPKLQASQRETMLWCDDRQLTATPSDEEEIKRRRKLLDHTQELLQEAMTESRSLTNRLLRRNYSSLSKYQRSIELMSQANPASFISFTKRLRS